MKTPKELLLQRYEAVESKLDAARRNALATLPQPRAGLREFLFTMRWHLAGLSAVWLAVFCLHLDFNSPSAVTVAQGNVPPARNVLASLIKNRRELIELTETNALPPEHAAMPARRTALQPPIEMA